MRCIKSMVDFPDDAQQPWRLKMYIDNDMANYTLALCSSMLN
jgi:hypothetical protein